MAELVVGLPLVSGKGEGGDVEMSHTQCDATQRSRFELRGNAQ